MDFYGMKRTELQHLCRKHGIPANLKSSEMADRLTSAFKEKENEKDVMRKEFSSEDSFDKDRIDETLIVRKENKKVKFRSENEIFEFTRSVKKQPRRSGRTRDENCVQDFQDAGKGVRRSKRNAANDASESVQTEKVSIRSNCDAMEGHKVVRRSKRIASGASGQDGTELVIDELYTNGQVRLIEQPHVRSSQFAGKDNVKGLSLGIKVNELQMEANPQDVSKLEKTRRRSTRITADVKEPIVEGETQEVETLFSAKDSKEEKRARRSKRLAASYKAESEPVKNNAKESLVDNNVLITAIQPRKSIPGGSEVEKVPRRSRRIKDNVNILSAAPEINNNELNLVDGKSGKQGDVEVEKAPRRSKRLGPNDGSQEGAQKIHMTNAHMDGQTQKREQPPKDCSVNDFQDRKLLRRSNRIAVDNDALQVGAKFNNLDKHVKDQNEVTAEQLERFIDDSPRLRKVVRRSRRLAASEDEQIGDFGINVVEQDIEDKSLSTSKRTRKCTQVALGEENNLRRSTRSAARAGQGAGGSVDEMKNPHIDNKVQVHARPTRNSSRHNSRKAQKGVEENMVGKKTDDAPESQVKPHSKSYRKMKRDISGTSKVDAEVVSSQSSVTLEELSTENGEIGPEVAAIGNGAEICTKQTTRSSSKKRKIVDQECTMEKPQGLIDVSPSLSVTEATKPALRTENILDPCSKSSASVSEGMDSQQLTSIQGRLIQDEMIDHTKTTSSLHQFPDEGLLVGTNDSNSGVKPEVKKGRTNNISDVNLFDEDGGQTTSVHLEEIKLKAQVVVDSAHTLAKDSASMFLTKQDTVTKKEKSVSTLESDLNASSVVAEEATEAAASHVILEKLNYEIINDSDGCWEEVHTIKDHDKGSMEDVGAASLHGSFSECNTKSKSGEEQADIKVDCDISGGKTSFKTTTTVPSTTTLVENMATKKEEASDVTSLKIHSDVTETESESMRRSSVINQTNLSAMDEGLDLAEEAFCIQPVSHGASEFQDMTSMAMSIGKEIENFKERSPESTEKHHAPTETSLLATEERDLQSKVADSVTCEEIYDSALADDKTIGMAIKEVMLMSNSEEKLVEDLLDNDVEVSEILRYSKVLTYEEEKNVALGEASFGHCENLETPSQANDDSLKKFMETNSSDRGYKQDILDLSRSPSAQLDSKTPMEERAPKLSEGESMSASSQSMLRNKAASFHDELFIFTTLERSLMLRDELDKNRKAFPAESAIQYSDEAVKSPDEHDVFTSPVHGQDEAGNDGENVAIEFHDEEKICTIPKRDLTLAGDGPNEGGEEGENTASKFHDESAIAISQKRHLSLRDFNQDGVGINEENKDVEFHGVSGIFTTPERDLLLGDTGLEVAEISRENKASEIRVESSGLAGEDIHDLLRDSELEMFRKNKEKENIELKDESGNLTSVERHLLLGDPEQDEARQQGLDTADEYHDESAVFTSTERELLLGDYDVEEAGKKKDCSAPKFHAESVVSTVLPERHPLSEESEIDRTGKYEEGHLSLGNSEVDNGKEGDDTAVKPLDSNAAFTIPEKVMLLHDTEPDRAGNCDEECKNVESSFFTTVERHLLFRESELHEEDEKRDSTAAKSNNEPSVFTCPERHLLLGDSESDEARRNDQNKEMELHNESVSSTSSKDHLHLGVSALPSHDELTLGDSNREELGSKEERSRAHVLTELKANVVTIEGAEQKTLDLEEKDQHNNGLGNSEETSNESEGQIPKVGSDSERAEAAMEAEANVEKGSREKNLSVQIEGGVDAEESGPSNKGEDAMNESDEAPMKTNDETDNNRAEELVERNLQEDKLTEHECLVMDPTTSETIADTEKGSVGKNFPAGEISMINPSTNLLDLEESGHSIHSLDPITGNESDNMNRGECIEASAAQSPAGTLDVSESDASSASEDENSGFDSEERCGSVRKTTSHGGDNDNKGKSLGSEATAPDDSVHTSPTELTVQNEEEQVTGERMTALGTSPSGNE